MLGLVVRLLGSWSFEARKKSFFDSKKTEFMDIVLGGVYGTDRRQRSRRARTP
jgi:hypothetical protein